MFSFVTFEDFHFLRAEWLFALLPLMLLVYAVRHLHKQQSGWQSVFGRAPLPAYNYQQRGEEI